MTSTGTKLSVIVLTHDEEHNLPACLASLRPLGPQIFIVDSGSADRTLEIARELAARWSSIRSRTTPISATGRSTTSRSRPPGPSASTPTSASRPSSRPRSAPSSPSPRPRHDGYMLRKRTLFMGRWIRHGGQYPAWHLRLFRSGHGRCEDRLYDQHFLVRGSVGRLDHDYVDVITSDLGTFIARHNRWAELEAREILAATAAASPPQAAVTARLTGTAIERRRFLRTRVYQRFPLFVRPFLFWIYGYVFRLGFLDGVEGLIFHTLQRFWFRFLIDAKIWEMKRRAGSAARTSSQPAADAHIAGPHNAAGPGGFSTSGPRTRQEEPTTASTKSQLI